MALQCEPNINMDAYAWCWWALVQQSPPGCPPPPCNNLDTPKEGKAHNLFFVNYYAILESQS